jgi:uncharacterized membrane protein YeaQ/YmgE (transglycosylase-associated protein family)
MIVEATGSGKGRMLWSFDPRAPRLEATAAATRPEGEHMDGIIGLIISLISGVVGGNIAGGVLKEQSLGPIGNSIAGLVGGGLGGQILSALGVFGGTAAAGAGAQAAASISAASLAMWLAPALAAPSSWSSSVSSSRPSQNQAECGRAPYWGIVYNTMGGMIRDLKVRCSRGRSSAPSTGCGR